MSRHLAEKAMNYFDECVSVSTFDSGEFSSLEDPQADSVIGIPPMGSSRIYPNEGPTFSVSDFLNGQTSYHEDLLDNQTQCSLSSVGSDLAIRSSCSNNRKAAHLRHVNGNHGDLVDYDKPRTGNFQLSFACEVMEDVGNNEIGQYVKTFENEIRKERIVWM